MGYETVTDFRLDKSSNSIGLDDFNFDRVFTTRF